MKQRPTKRDSTPALRVVVAGNNRLACDILDLLLTSGCRVMAIPEGVDMFPRDMGWERPFARHARQAAGPPSKPGAASRRVELLAGPPRGHRESIAVWQPDLLLSCRLKSRVPPEVLRIPRLGCLNAHYGLLPRYGGVQPIPWAIFNGEKEIGVTWHLMEPEWDSGAIVVQRSIPIGEQDTAHTLYQSANRTALDALEETLPRIASAIARARPQDVRARTYYDRSDFRRLVEMKSRLDRALGFSP